MLSGEKVVVFNGANCNQMVVLARTAGDQWERDGLSLFVVAADAEGVNRVDYAMMDGQRVANITFDNVSLGAEALLGEAGAAMATVCLLYTSPSPRDVEESRMPSSA